MSDFKAKMHQIVCRLRLRPDPAGGTYSAPRNPLAGFQGPTSKGEEEGTKVEGRGRERRRGKDRRGEKRGGKVEERDGKGEG